MIKFQLVVLGKTDRFADYYSREDRQIRVEQRNTSKTYSMAVTC
jgi:hypothetical protein